MDEITNICETTARDRPSCGMRGASPSGWKYTVKVWAEPGDPIAWYMESGLKDPNSDVLVFNKTRDSMPKADFYLIEFDLEDHSSLGLSFEPNPMNAFWVAMGDRNSAPPCPATASYCESIYATCVDSTGAKLTVRNDDMDIELFSFSLGFVSSVDGSHYRYDPGGSNQNGGTSAY